MKTLDDFIRNGSKLKTKTFFFRVEVGLMDYLDYLHDLTGISRSQLVREAIQDKTKANRIIKKLLDKQTLVPRDYDFIQKIMNEPH